MGQVYLAHDTKLDRKVALKILFADVVADKIGDRVRRFLQDFAARPDPHVVRRRGEERQHQEHGERDPESRRLELVTQFEIRN